MNAADLKSCAPFLPADVAESVARAALHVRGAAVAMVANAQSSDIPTVLLGCASLITSHLVGLKNALGTDTPQQSTPENGLLFPSGTSAVEAELFRPTLRELLDASDNPVMPLYLAGLDAATAILSEIDDANIIGIDNKLAFRVAVRGFIDHIPADLLADFIHTLEAIYAPFWGAGGVPALDSADAEILVALATKDRGDHD